MQDKSFVPFTKDMIQDYTILVPNMLPRHFKLMIRILETYGYHFELLQSSGPQVIETGLKYAHNDICYPAILVIGQFMDALLSGRYDLHKTALIMFQTGGGCRASNYVSLIRKALAKAGMEYIPVISLSLAGLENHPGFRLTVHKLHKLLYAVLYGDLLMSLVNQVRPYELEPGQAESLADRWTDRLGASLGSSKHIRYGQIRDSYSQIVRSFMDIPMDRSAKVKVGIVGEIYVKYSPFGNNDLERFLIREDAEPVVPGFLDFCLFCVYNGLMDYELYRHGRVKQLFMRPVYCLLCRKRNDVSRALEESGVFSGFTPFEQVVGMADEAISRAVKMGEGWLLTAEMLELSRSGCKNIICTQPFGCLPNHICGKGMMKPVKELCPDTNIVAIDFDAGASRVNQENRLKLMLANAKNTAASTLRADMPKGDRDSVRAGDTGSNGGKPLTAVPNK